jgi:serine/threonine protein kinase
MPISQNIGGFRGDGFDDVGSDTDDVPHVRPFFSFSSFVLQNEDPTIFEWRFHKEIGKGAMSRVFTATNTETGELCAAKVYNKGMLMRQTLGNEEPPYLAVQREIDIMASLNHRYVLPIVEVIEDDCSNSLIMIMPFAAKGTLQGFLDETHPDEATLAVCFYEIAEGLRFIHEQRVVHRDLKPDNILVFSENRFFLSDFSVSTRIESDDQMLVDTRGSPAFLSPEECGGEPFYPKPADVWAYGITLCSAIFNFLPFSLDQGQGKNVANTVFAVTQLLQSQELVIPEDRGFSPHLIDLLKRVLRKKPEERPSFQEIMKSPWFEAALEIDAAYAEEERKLLEEQQARMAAEEEQQEEEAAPEPLPVPVPEG